MAVRKRGSSWQADFMVDGRRHRESFPTEQDALVWEHEAKAAALAGRPIPPVRARPAAGSSGTLQALCDEVERTHWSKQPRSYRKTMVNVRQVLKAFGPKLHIRDLTRARLDQWVEDELDRGNRGSTVNRKLAVLSKVFRLAEDSRHIDRAPSLPYQKPGGNRIRTIAHEEEAAILRLFRSWDEPDMVAFTVIGIETGLRLSEMLSMEWTSVADDLSRWQVEGGKTPAARRVVALSPAVRNEIVSLRHRHPDSTGPLAFMRRDFENRWRDLWDKMRRTLGLDDVVIHTMRHTCATRLCALCQGGEDIKLTDVKKWMGHSSLMTTQLYVHPDDSAMVRLMEEREAGKNRLRRVA